MIEQQGQVVRLQEENAFVRVGATSGCLSCESGKGCGGGIFARLVPKKPVTLEVPITTQSPQPKVGQQVLLGISDVFFLRWTALLFGAPLVVGLLAAGLAQWLADSSVIELSLRMKDALVLSAAMTSAVVTLFIIRMRSEALLTGVSELCLLKVLPNSSCSKRP